MTPPLTPYVALRQRTGKPEGWRPVWAQSRTVHRIDGRTVYAARPTALTAADQAELSLLATLGWCVEIASLGTHTLVTISKKGTT